MSDKSMTVKLYGGPRAGEMVATENIEIVVLEQRLYDPVAEANMISRAPRRGKYRVQPAGRGNPLPAAFWLGWEGATMEPVVAHVRQYYLDPVEHELARQRAHEGLLHQVARDAPLGVELVEFRVDETEYDLITMADVLRLSRTYVAPW